MFKFMNTRPTNRSGRQVRLQKETNQQEFVSPVGYVATMSNDAHAAATASGHATGQTPTTQVFAPISPVLRSVDPIQVAAFLKERERFEMEIAAKQAEIPALAAVP